jgi:hypothetical protein
MGWKGSAVKPPDVIVNPPGATAYPAPTGLALAGKRVSLGVHWNAVTAKVNGNLPTGYTVQCVQMNGVKGAPDQVVTGTSARFDLLVPGFQYHIYVWANGGATAPPHAEMTVTA